MNTSGRCRVVIVGSPRDLNESIIGRIAAALSAAGATVVVLDNDSPKTLDMLMPKVPELTPLMVAGTLRVDKTYSEPVTKTLSSKYQGDGFYLGLPKYRKRKQ